MASGHGHVLTATGRHRGRLGAVLAITLGIAVAEVCGALVSGSLVLLADAAHMAADVQRVFVAAAAHQADVALVGPGAAIGAAGHADAELLVLETKPL